MRIEPTTVTKQNKLKHRDLLMKIEIKPKESD